MGEEKGGGLTLRPVDNKEMEKTYAQIGHSGTFRILPSDHWSGESNEFREKKGRSKKTEITME